MNTNEKRIKLHQYCCMRRDTGFADEKVAFTDKGNFITIPMYKFYCTDCPIKSHCFEDSMGRHSLVLFEKSDEEINQMYQDVFGKEAQTYIEAIMQALPDANVERIVEYGCPSCFFKGAPMYNGNSCNLKCKKCWNQKRGGEEVCKNG